MSQQSVRQAARRSALDAQAVLHKERAAGEVSTSSIHLLSRFVIFQPLNVLQVRR